MTPRSRRCVNQRIGSSSLITPHSTPSSTAIEVPESFHGARQLTEGIEGGGEAVAPLLAQPSDKQVNKLNSWEVSFFNNL